MKRSLFILSLLGMVHAGYSQCVTTNIPNDYVQSADIILSGVINVTGTYTLPAGVTITIPSYGVDNCGSLTINADKIIINGNIIGDYSGYTGGAGGLGGTTVSSITGHEDGLTGCVAKDDAGQITVHGGQAGIAGGGPGAGLSGGNGTVGSGTKQQCQNVGDEAGLIGAAGGAGGGGGASYGGDGISGLIGGAGSGTGSATGFSFSTAYTPIGGLGGIGGGNGTSYGTASGTDIDLGSGGAGAGGGGRSFYIGDNGLAGGNGGGMVKLVAADTLIVTGTISVNGENGKAGGKGGNGDATTDCCSDACNDCAERTVSAGAGGGSGSGAGSGGGILLQSDYYISVTGNLSANGGNGGSGGAMGTGVTCTYNSPPFCGSNNMVSDNGNAGAIGGSGGGGRIKIFGTNCPSNVITPTHSEAGGTGAAAGTFQTVIVTCPDFVGLENYNGTINASVYPNPAEDLINVQIQDFSLGMKDANVLIYDANGKVMNQKNVVLEKGAVVQMPVTGLSSGIYVIVIRNNNGQASYRFIKK